MLLKSLFSGVFNGVNFYLHYRLNYGIKPSFLVYQITERCNGKCTMCNIWNQEPREELKINEISKGFSNRFFNNLKWIVLTGGEPFLRNDLVELIEVLSKLPSLKWITINTNGFLTEKIINDVKKILKSLRNDITLSLTISIHSINAVHDKITGIVSAYHKATSTLRALQKIKNKKLHLQILSVISKYNFE